MTSRISPTLNKLSWTVGVFGTTFLLRLAQNLLLSRILSPEIFGVVVIINTVRYGVELLTDVGVEQNIVRHPRGLDSTFLNTAWTIQVIRGCFLTIVFLCLTPLLATIYRIEPAVFMAISLAPLLNSLHSTSVFALVKRLEVKRRNIFELTSDVISFSATLLLALLTPTVWAVVSGVLISVTARSLLSYSLPDSRHRFAIDIGLAREILSFGKWIMISSLLVYASTNLDRILLGGLAPLAAVGIYGLARTIADVPPNLALRLGHQLIFPMLSAQQSGEAGAQVRLAAFTRARLAAVLITAAGTVSIAAWSDTVVKVLFDDRYAAASWMLAFLMLGSTVTVFAALGEAVLLGADRPAPITLANVARVGVLAVGLPIGYATLGLSGAIAAVLAAEFARYVCITTSEQTLRHFMWRQDVLAALIGGLVLLMWLVIREMAGLGTPWGAM